jgi:hypothetical protein
MTVPATLPAQVPKELRIRAILSGKEEAPNEICKFLAERIVAIKAEREALIPTLKQLEQQFNALSGRKSDLEVQSNSYLQDLAEFLDKPSA